MAPGSTRSRCVRRLAAWVASIERDHTVRVAVDGPDAAGKTTLAGEVADCLAEVHGRPAICVSLDGFHFDKQRRYRRGRLSPEGYIEDSFDVEALKRVVLDPLGPGGSMVFHRATFDFKSDKPVRAPSEQAPPGAVLLVDGVFLQGRELSQAWDARVFVRVSRGEALRRALRRDVELFGSPVAVQERYEQRYLPAQHLYATRVRPAEHADVVIDNEDAAYPRMTFTHHATMRHRWTRDPGWARSAAPSGAGGSR
jgi:uridine kinase